MTPSLYLNEQNHQLRGAETELWAASDSTAKINVNSPVTGECDNGHVPW